MFARLTSAQVRTDKIDKAIEIYKGSVIPAAQSQKGYNQALFLTDHETGKILSITIWDTEEDALANEKNNYYQTQLVKYMALLTTGIIREGFEVAFQDSKT